MTPNQEEILKKKIAQFKAEVGNRKLTPEQKKIYAAFTKTKGRPIQIVTYDKFGDEVKFIMDPTKRKEGPQHILEKHYRSDIGSVTANEILNLTEVINKGSKTKREQCVNYKLKKEVKEKKFTISIKITESKKVLKSFYSDRSNKKRS